MRIVTISAVSAMALGATILAAQSQQPATKTNPFARPAQRPARAAAQQPAATQSAANRMVVYKSPTCGCCGNWVTHARNAGFQVDVHDVADVSEIKRTAGVPTDAQSCHTTQVGGYFVEGHVPVDDIRRMLAERPAIRGIAAPGMPAGSPGMEVPGGRRDAYQVIAVRRDGTTFVWASH